MSGLGHNRDWRRAWPRGFSDSRLPVPSMLNDLFLLGKLTGLGLVILLPWPIP